MHQALDTLEKFIHAEAQIPPLARAGMIHYQFEAIHQITGYARNRIYQADEIFKGVQGIDVE